MGTISRGKLLTWSVIIGAWFALFVVNMIMLAGVLQFTNFPINIGL